MLDFRLARTAIEIARECIGIADERCLLTRTSSPILGVGADACLSTYLSPEEHLRTASISPAIYYSNPSRLHINKFRISLL